MNILIIAYNRPDTTKKLFKIIKQIKPQNLFVSIDAPKNCIDIHKCNQVKQIFQKIDWECNFYKKYNKQNKGCTKNIISSIDWFFKHVKDGIILEDDCIPNITFFRFCQELLDKYRLNRNIFMISGTSFITKHDRSYSYRFTRLVTIWGWATWKRAWNKRLKSLSTWPKYNKNEIMKFYQSESKTQIKLIEEQYSKPSTLKWGTLWRFSCLFHKAINIAPNKNLIRNLGFGRKDATTTNFNHPIEKNKVYKIKFPLKHPNFNVDNSLDTEMLKYYYSYKKVQ